MNSGRPPEKKLQVLNLAMEFPIVERGGGPSTYLHNLKKGLEFLKADGIGFYSTIGFLPSIESYKSQFIIRNLKRLIKSVISKGSFCEEIYLLRQKQMYNRLKNKAIDFLSNIPKLDILHLHTVISFYYLKHYAEKKGCITILTPHTPEAPFIEYAKNILNSCKGLETDNFSELEKSVRTSLEFYKKLTYESFEKADCLLFPAEEVMEPYFETMPGFERIMSKKKLIFVPTGVPPICSKGSNMDVRKNLNIPESAIVVLFIGRHNKVKGYDILQDAAKLVWKKNKSIYFLILGKEFPIKGLSDYRWIEVGWRDNIHDYIVASDIFVLPNRRTFFDLVLLEVMSCKKVIIASETGGNKFVSKLSEGVLTFKPVNPEKLADKILEVASLSEVDRGYLGYINYVAYNNYFTVDKFAENYILQLSSII